MKRLILLLLTAIMLFAFGCRSDYGTQPVEVTESLPIQSPTSEAPSVHSEIPSEPVSPNPQFRFTTDNLPVIDGSTSLVPLGKAVVGALLGISQEAAAEHIAFNKTDYAYYNLMGNNDVSLVIAAGPAQEVVEYKDSIGYEWLMEPIATEALVFIVNADNPVDSLTSEQVRGIYTGEITNWSQVGGDDLEITAFQRNNGSGSQTLILKLVMGSLPLADPPVEYVISEMGGLMEAIKSYDNAANSMGYSVYYYANDMRMAEGLKIMKIDGVEPNLETIADGSYPFLDSYYVAISAEAESDSPEKILFNWLLSDEGQALIASQGYVPVR